jgi:hypothetical protein
MDPARADLRRGLGRGHGPLSGDDLRRTRPPRPRALAGVPLDQGDP